MISDNIDKLEDVWKSALYPSTEQDKINAEKLWGNLMLMVCIY